MILDTIGDLVMSTIRTIFNTIFGQALEESLDMMNKDIPEQARNITPKTKFVNDHQVFFIT